MWDGRRPSLESQVLEPLMNSTEHGLADLNELLSKLHANDEYKALFAEGLGVALDNVQPKHVAEALSAFVDGLPRPPTAVELYLTGNSSALNEHQKRGLVIFRKRAKCAECHLIRDGQAAVADGKFHSVGVGLGNREDLAVLATRAFSAIQDKKLDEVVLSDRDLASLGRFLVTQEPRDIGKFRTPGLRRVSKTAPYMHDGSVATLEEALDRELYYRGLTSGSPIDLTPDERADLIHFLKSL